MSDKAVYAAKSAAGWSIALSVLMILAGLLAIVLPPTAAIAVTLVVGWLLIFSGIAHLLFAWQAFSAGGVVWELLVGVVYIIAGGYLLMHPVAGMEALTLALAIYLFVEAILEFVLSFQLRPAPGSGWLLADSIVTFILAIMIWRMWPFGTPWVLGTLVGISVLFSGVSRLVLSVAARRVASELAK
jgi:uncharacterized membrane protein HdeD (DUF308 family)